MILAGLTLEELENLMSELGATKDMLKDIADSCIESGGYKVVSHEEIYEILKEAY